MTLPSGSSSVFRALLVCASLVGCADEGDVPLTDAASSASAWDASGLDGGPKVGADAGSPADGGSLTDAERVQDTRTYTVDPAKIVLAPLVDAKNETDRYLGVLDNAGYMVEVPQNWNGVLVMYAHGYRGAGAELTVGPPRIRRYLVDNGYAWAASSYSKNNYDVRAGVEDTNKLALRFNAISEQNGRKLDPPKKRYLIGHSMGGHVAGAAIEKEAQATAINRVHYDGAVPMCGVLGDTALFDYFAAYQAAAHQVTGVPVPAAGSDYMPTLAQLKAALFTTFPTATTPAGEKLKGIVMNLTGGSRPMFDQGFASPLQATVFGAFGGDGTANGILNANVINTRDVEYQLDSDPALSADEVTFNEQVSRATGSAAANAPRADGLRWVPAVNGEFDIPVVSLHTLGDIYVPFSMEQIYRRRAEQKVVVDAITRGVRERERCGRAAALLDAGRAGRGDVPGTAIADAAALVGRLGSSGAGAAVDAVRQAVAVRVLLTHPAATAADSRLVGVRRTLVDAVGRSVAVAVTLGHAASAACKAASARRRRGYDHPHSGSDPPHPTRRTRVARRRWRRRRTQGPRGTCTPFRRKR
jgi:hypothetical protein